MFVHKDICNSAICSLECLDACKGIHDEDPPLEFDKKDRQPSIDESSCTKCLACLRACPLNAIVMPTTEAQTRENKSKQEKSSSNEKPYQINESLSPMSEADTIFARVQYDPEYEFYQKTEFSGSEAMIAKDIPGYGRFENELSIAAWKLYDSRNSIQRPGIGLDPAASEHGTRLITNPKDLTSMIKKASRFFGAHLVGITSIDRNWLYTKDRRGNPYNIPESFQYAIVMAIEMDYEAIATSPSFTSSAATGLGYSKMAFVEIELASFIQRLGYEAMTCGNNVALSVPLAIDAGLGQYGRHGILITKQFGPRVRIAKVLTDMKLVSDSPDIDFCKSVVRFCETCEKCAISCPSQSIPYGKDQTWKGITKSNNPGVKKWFVDVETCYGFWLENGSECSNCIRSCPYNKNDGILHRTVLWFIQHFPILNRLIVKLNDVVGYGKQKSGNKFWKKLS